MAEVLVKDLDAELFERLKDRAHQHGRSLDGEVKAILESASPRTMEMEEARRVAEEWQRRLAGRIQGDSADLIREDRER